MIDAPFVEAAKSERSTGTGTGFDRQVAVDVIEVQPPLGGGALEDGFGQPRVEERRYQLRPKDVSITEGTGRLRTHDPDRNEPLEPVLRNPAAISSAAAPRKDASRSGVCADGLRRCVLPYLAAAVPSTLRHSGDLSPGFPRLQPSKCSSDHRCLKPRTLLVRIHHVDGSLARHPREAWWVHFRLTSWRATRAGTSTRAPNASRRHRR
jgi:hypothetical protein